MEDIIIIGGGVIGSLIARNCSAYDLQVTLLEKHSDIAMGTTKANSGIVHAGYDAKPGTLKARFNREGNKIMHDLTKELDVPFKRIGSLVVAFNEKDMEQLEILYKRGLANDIPDMAILNQAQVREMEPELSHEIIGALHAPTAGIVSPYELAVAAAEVAARNGVCISLEEEVRDIVANKEGYIVKTNKGCHHGRLIINAAGTFSDNIATMIGDESVQIIGRKGEYMLLDKNQGNKVGKVIFQPPTKHGKGILVTPTAEGNLLIGPTAEEVDKDDDTTSKFGLKKILDGAKRSLPHFDEREVIRSFAGIRAVGNTGDFIIRPAKKHPNFIHVAGIESPGLTAAPAIADYVIQLIEERRPLTAKKDVKLGREPIKRFADATIKERHAMINHNPSFGNIICRCEMVTEAEIVDCIHRPSGARNLDAIKRRTRAGMGRCQGGFCTPKIVEILSRELQIPMNEVTLKGEGSYLLVSETKGKHEGPNEEDAK